MKPFLNTQKLIKFKNTRKFPVQHIKLMQGPLRSDRLTPRTIFILKKTTVNPLIYLETEGPLWCLQCVMKPETLYNIL